MMRSIGGCKSPRQTSSKLKFSKSFLRCSSSLLLGLIYLTTSFAWNQYPLTKNKLGSMKRCNGTFLFSGRLQSMSTSFIESRQQKLKLIRETKKTSFSRKLRVDGGGDNYKGKIFNLRNARFGQALLRVTFLQLIASVILRPGSAIAATIQAASPVAVRAPMAPLMTCPVSAATEFRLMVRLVFAALLGAALGKERSFAKHSAGVRTMSLVSMGAAVFTVCSGYGFSNFPRVDASRMAANVASGVGFVGAGVITTSVRNQNKGNPNHPQNNVVHGLTTAATIWLSAAVGVSCGVGLLRVATTAAFATIFILRMGRKRNRNNSTNDNLSVQKQERYRSKKTYKKEGVRGFMNTSGDCFDDDVNAEIHVTTHWDEHQDQENVKAEKHPPSLKSDSRYTVPGHAAAESQKQQENKMGIEKEDNLDFMESDIGEDVKDMYNYLKEPSAIMEEIVHSALKNDKKTVTELVDLVLHRVEQRDRISRRSSNSREDHPSSSNSEYLP